MYVLKNTHKICVRGQNLQVAIVEKHYCMLSCNPHEIFGRLNTLVADNLSGKAATAD